MALIFPREAPWKGASGQAFEPQRVDYGSPEAGGALGGVQAGFPRWLATWDLGRMGADASDEWRAFHLSMRGGQRRFYGRDLSRPFPKAHRAGFARMTDVAGAPFLGAASAWSEEIDEEGSSLLTLEGLPAGLILSVGDYIGFKWDGEGDDAESYKRRALVRAIEGGVADAAGAVTVTSEPPLPALVPEGAIAHLDRPACVMGFVDGTQLGPIGRSLAIGGGKIVALEDLRP